MLEIKVPMKRLPILFFFLLLLGCTDDDNDDCICAYTLQTNGGGIIGVEEPCTPENKSLCE